MKSPLVSYRKTAYFIYLLFFTAVICPQVLPEDESIPVAEDDLYNQCKESYKEGKFAEAGDIIEKFLSTYTESAYIDEILYMKAFLQSDINSSVEIYARVIEGYPNSQWAAKSHFQLGQYYYLREEYDKALDHYGRILVSYSDSEMYWLAVYWKGKSLIAKGDYERAVSTLGSLSDKTSEDISMDMILLSLGNSYLGLRDYKNAANSYRDLIESMPDSERVPSAYLLFAKCLQNLGEVEKAKSICQKLIEDYPQSMEAALARECVNSSKPFEIGLVDVKPEKPEIPQPSQVDLKSDEKEQKTLEDVADKTIDAKSDSTESKNENEPVADEPKPTPVKKRSYYYTIQVGAFSNQENADRLAEQLREKGYSVIVVHPVSNKSKLHKVRVGHFSTRRSALEAAKALGENENLPTDVVRQGIE
jgi:TolA-binding protein